MGTFRMMNNLYLFKLANDFVYQKNLVLHKEKNSAHFGVIGEVLRCFKAS